EAEGREAVSEDPRRQQREREQDGVEQRHQRQTGYGLHETGEGKHRPAQARAPAGDQRQRQAQQDPQRERGGAQQYMITEILGQDIESAREGAVHAHAPLAAGPSSSARTRSACWRGISISIRTSSSGGSVRSARGVPSATIPPSRIMTM